MSWKNFTCMSSAKDWWNRKRKLCVCGSHSANDAKKNKHHNATRKRLFIRLERKFKVNNL